MLNLKFPRSIGRLKPQLHNGRRGSPSLQPVYASEVNKIITPRRIGIQLDRDAVFLQKSLIATVSPEDLRPRVLCESTAHPQSHRVDGLAANRVRTEYHVRVGAARAKLN